MRLDFRLSAIPDSLVAASWLPSDPLLLMVFRIGVGVIACSVLMLVAVFLLRLRNYRHELVVGSARKNLEEFALALGLDAIACDLLGAQYMKRSASWQTGSGQGGGGAG